jgi:serralysin
VKFATVAPGSTLSAGDFLVTGPANNAPVFSSGTSASIAENSPVSTIVYQAVATDADGDSISYALGGADAALFTIDASGAVRLIQAADYEVRPSYSLTVTASDSGPAAATRSVTVNVTDRSERGPTPRDREFPFENESIDTAQEIHWFLLEPSINPNLPDDDLPSITMVGSISTPADKDFYSISLAKGQLLILDLDLSGGNLDALINVYGPNHQFLASGDDHITLDPGSAPHPEYGHNTDPLVRFRAPATGTYFFSVESFQGGTARTSGSYELNVSVGPPATPAQLLEEDVLAMLSGQEWSALNLTYGFPTRESDYRTGEWAEEISAGMGPLDTQQQNAVRTILGQAANFTNLAFTQSTGTPGSAQLRYALSDLPETAYAAFPGAGMGGDSWYNILAYDSPRVGNYEWLGFLHETGHALGLKHPHEAPAVSLRHDLLAYTVMSYRSYEGAPVNEDGGYTNETWGFPQTYMMLDIAALQHLYGADFSYNSGNTTYSWNPNTGAFLINGGVQWTPGANRVFMTIWDGGGIDTYNLANYSGHTIIDLRPGGWVQTGAHQLARFGDGSLAEGNVANALLYNGDQRSLIERAIGGTDNDTFIANEAANRFTGNGGFNQFQWNSVADSPVGAADVITDYHGDILNFSGIDAIKWSSADDPFTLIGSNAFTGVSGQLRWEATGDRIDIFGDVDGDAVADLHVIAYWDDVLPPWIPDHFIML